MTTDQGRLFQPRLESLEDRYLLTVWPGYRFLLPSFALRFAAASALAGGTHTPAQIHTVVNPGNVFLRTVSIVPQHISLGLFDQPSPVNVRGFNPGLSVPGLPGPTVIRSDFGYTTPGLPYFYTPSQPVTPPPLQVGGLTLLPNGTVIGNFP
jgi:hypothetical protein